MCRTILNRKPLPSTSSLIKCDAVGTSVTLKLLIVLIGSTSCGNVLANWVKSCLPMKS